jgi:signal transduction histidine kinase/ligand-binding sensor domain-containing protein
MLSRLLLVWLAGILYLSTAAQAPPPVFHSLGVTEGLSHSSVYSVMQDSEGFIWAGTADGLNRYDGSSITVYKAPVASGREASFLRSPLFEDKLHNIWFVNAAGIWCMNRSSNKLLHKLRFSNQSVVSFMLSESAEIWIIDPFRGMIRYNTLSGDTSTIPFPFTVRRERIQYVHAAGTQGFCWMKLYGDDGYWQYDRTNGSFVHFLAGRNVTSLCTDDDALWVASGKQLLQIGTDGKVNRTITFSDDASLGKVSVRTDASGNTWVATYGNGLMLYDPQDRLLRHYRRDHHRLGSLSSDFCTSLTIDKARNLWIGTDGGGLARLSLKPAVFGKFPADERDFPELPDFFIKAVYEDEQGLIWFSTLNGPLSCYNTATEELRSFKGKGSPSRINNIFPLEDGSLLLSHLAGLTEFRNGRFLPLPVSFPQGYNPARMGFNISRYTRVSSDRLLAATSLGLIQLTQTAGKWKSTFIGINGVEGLTLNDIIAAGGGKDHWIAAPGQGLQLLRIDGLKGTTIRRELQRDDIVVMHKDEINDQILWLGTSNGLIKFNTTTREARRYSVSNGLQNDNVYSIREDEYHSIWISTNGGLSRIWPDGRINNFTHKSGLQSNEFNSKASSKGRSSGRLIFGGVAGFNWFSGRSVSLDTSRARAAITQVKINELDAAPAAWKDDRIRLSHEDNNLSFRMAVTDYTRPDANKISYWLEGWDKNPVIAVPGMIRYSHLPPGSYTLHVKAAGSNDLFGPEILRFISITPPFWQRSWFYVLCGLTVTGLFAFIIYYTGVRKLRKARALLAQQKLLEEERSRISHDLHDEVGSALTQISLLSSLIPMQPDLPPQLLSDVDRIGTVAHRVTQSIGDIIWTLHPQDDSLAGTLAYIREQCVDFLGPLDTSFSIDFPEVLPEITLSSEQRRNLLLVTKESINNAVKHASATHISIRCSWTANTLVFEIADDGKGFIRSTVNKNGHGLHNLQRRMNSIHGTIEWLQPGKGTTVRYAIPLS